MSAPGISGAPGRRPWPGALDWGGDWASETAVELADLGFVLRDGLHAGDLPGPRLLVAFRPAPTLRHFDPEEATYWVSSHGRGERRQLSREGALPGDGDAPFAWGRILVADRIPVTNQFLSFGGRLLTALQPDGTRLAAFVSRAPIVRWAGHSQGTDPLADAIGSFYARIRVPIDYQPDAEQRVAAASPEALYAAFLEHACRRIHAAARLAAADPAFASSVSRERSRMRNEAPAPTRDGVALLDWLEVA